MNNQLGMFIHWGIYALTEYHEQAMARLNISHEDYEALARQFNPTLFDPDSWVLLAKNAGMKYICFTAKHHDGFCMWDTQYTDYNIMNTPYGKDVLKLLAEACARHDMKLSLYYSCPDWHNEYAYNSRSTHQWKSKTPERADSSLYRAYVKNQITELLSNYGKIYTLFWDIPPMIEDKSINALVRSLQPDILINDRGYDEGDFSTPERTIPTGGRFSRRTEACQSVGEQSWGYRADEDYYTLRYLMMSIDKIMAMGGSYLLNVGPGPDGTIPPAACERIVKIGGWYNRLEGTLEDAEADPFPYAFSSRQPVIALRKNGRTYLHFYDGVQSSAINFLHFPGIPASARLMNSHAPLTIRMENLPTQTGSCGQAQGPYLRITGIPADEFPQEPIVIEITW